MKIESKHLFMAVETGAVITVMVAALAGKFDAAAMCWGAAIYMRLQR